MNIIKTIRESNQLLLKTEGADIAKWSKLRHNKDDFELFLQFNIAEIEFLNKNGKLESLICTNNTTLIKILSTKKLEDKKKFVSFKNSGIHTDDTTKVLTWDLIDNKFKTVNLKTWQILNFISITEDNILILDELIRNILKQ